MNTLYELTSEYLQLLEMAEDPDVDLQTIADTMEAIGGEIEDKADGYARVMKQIEANAAGIKAEIDRLTARKTSMENNVKRMKESLQAAMEATGKKKFKTALFSFNIQKNPASLKIDDPEAVPESFLVPQPPKVDSAAIKDALKAGAVYDFAHLEQGESLRIR